MACSRVATATFRGALNCHFAAVPTSLCCSGIQKLGVEEFNKNKRGLSAYTTCLTHLVYLQISTGTAADKLCSGAISSFREKHLSQDSEVPYKFIPRKVNIFIQEGFESNNWGVCTTKFQAVWLHNFNIYEES